VLSVTPEATASASFQTARQKSARDDQSPPSASFGALVDANAQASQTATTQTSNSSDQPDTSSGRRPDPSASSQSDQAAPADDNAQTRPSNASSNPAQADSAAESDTGFHKPATGTETSANSAGHHSKHDGAKVTTTRTPPTASS